MRSAVDGSSRSFLQASRRAWAIVAAGGICMIASLYTINGWDRLQPATVKSAPWLSLVLWAVACVFFLAGSNADAAEYAGKDGANKLLRNAVISIGAMVILSYIAVLVAIALNESADMALKYGLFAPSLILGLFTAFRRDRRR